MRALVVALFIVLAAVAWISDDDPISTPAPSASRKAMCVDWINEQWVQLPCR